jgi:thiol-disulfide isomerase/thioredoxin
MNLRPILLLPLLLVAACDQKPVPVLPPPTAAVSEVADEVHWVKGDVEAAFASAKAQNKPVILYWGAEWCPPCHQLQATVFSRPDFIAKSKLFIPVYLDGDLEGAQKWGEQFKVTGYPTIVILDSERREVMRIAGGMDLSQYASVLDQALGNLQPVSDIFAIAARGEKLTSAQCQRLAYNGWVLDDTEESAYAAVAKRLVQAAALCPEAQRVERARLGIVAAYYDSNAEAAALKKGAAPSPALRAGVGRVSAVIDDASLAAPNSDVLTYLGDGFFTAVKAGGTASVTSFHERFTRTMDAASINERFAEPDRLSAVYRKLQATKVLTGSIPEPLIKEGVAKSEAALAGKQIPYERSGIMNSVMWIYDVLGRDAEAYALLQAELPKSATPYYYKADLASLAEKLGRKDEALQWSEQAYNESRGAATRFQWGNLYLGTLLRLTPEDTARIQQVGLKVLAEIEGEERIYRRARMRLESLDGTLRKWQSEARGPRTPVLRALRERVQRNCAKIPSAEPARASCDAFLAGAA